MNSQPPTKQPVWDGISSILTWKKEADFALTLWIGALWTENDNEDEFNKKHGRKFIAWFLGGFTGKARELAAEIPADTFAGFYRNANPARS